MTASAAGVSVHRDGAILVVRLDNPPVNALGARVRAALAEALAQAQRDPGVRALVVTGSGRMFSGGADISEFDKPMQPPQLPELIDRFEDSDLLTVAAINGTAMGGALELSMGCHHRIASEAATMALPEVKIGILPGAGGTQRMPRLIGNAAALDLIVTGKPVNAAKALSLGLVDELAPAEDFEDAVLDYVRRLLDAGAGPRRTRERDVDQDDALFEAALAKLPDTAANFAARRCVLSVQAASLPFREGQERESELFLECARSPTSAALIHAFFAERQAGKVEGLDPATPLLPIRDCAVLGAGTMGIGIALTLADAGLEVGLFDNSPDTLQRALAHVEKHYLGLAARGRFDEPEARARIARIMAGDDERLARVDLVIEAVFEDMALKKTVFADLDARCRPDAILASNTSTLDVDEIASATASPQRVLGLHFFSPANIMRLLEIVRGRDTSDSVLATAIALARRLRKVGVVCGVCDGFIGNRMLEGYGRESGVLLMEGASPAQIDAAITGFGFAMGPFAMSDLAGIDVGYRVRQQRGVDPADAMIYAVGDRLYGMGRYGQKTGAGFYRYESGSRKPIPDPEVDAIVEEEARRFGISRREIPVEEIVERCVLPLINEAANILDEGIAMRASDIDLVWLYGYGFPAWRGGPMHYANTLGTGRVLQSIRRYARDERYWTPAPLLERLAAEGKSFA
ncbi:3-hydroxyacyl-CoA dehydrogenase [Luteimonas aestuarii]|uniref:3-hydroxyacyl-CoA dehydrogenase n=1 Tax=Luteimonas aestuarii TaxID=453837 RepID=A0A4R5TYJ9_9GAMM|nr:3-hydroxyacyl-CoA dehydrogenase NAD-binding domain-containing protein [Luteimonas aestuarii]TDK26317.1 3-hydroxyacyl-CoA dehydrogenase [Luteimonas aestuarii]